MKKTKEMIEKLYEELDSKKESMILIYKDDEGGIDTYACGRFNELAGGIANIIDASLTDEGIGEGGKYIASVILEGVRAVISVPSEAGKILAKKMTTSLFEAMLLDKIGINTVKEAAKLLKDDEDCDNKDSDDEDEDCETCEANRICPLPQAIKYRKENGIPAPGKKHRKHNKKHDEKGN